MSGTSISWTCPFLYKSKLYAHNSQLLSEIDDLVHQRSCTLLVLNASANLLHRFLSYSAVALQRFFSLNTSPQPSNYPTPQACAVVAAATPE